MVGGGEGAFIGDVHRMAARLDGRFVLVAGALSSDPERARRSAEALGLDPSRSYDSFENMAEAEAARDDGIEAVSIVTPNHLHATAAKAFLSRGIHVICDKPMTATREEAESLADIARQSTARFILTHNYSGYPMIRQARELVTKGDLGTLRLIHVEYLQDWLTDPVEKEGSKQAEWRTDPERAGAGGALGDIGTHAHHLACFVSGLKVESLSADVHRFVEGRLLDDNAHIMLRYEEGVRGTLICSQIAPGQENGLTLRLFGSKGGLVWHQEKPNELWFTPHGEATRRITRNGAGAGEAANAVSRIPGGHPEGYLEAFANLYVEVAEALRSGQAATALPGIQEGLDGMRFVAACVRSSDANGEWVTP
ncbi:gfo/Idh/MocA family oxidoreductase [Notoacmeibacter ruber]|uniref:Gfo/Idh/MocA family oxidoreductase n=2 Tax=Notoacmeibacter ruber TaxID=2670375 RepID=A0A3L7JES1_9HYPH|nr:gfo/Idh/MocA family oxidoreductase [Notoacmeibacter ruber]